MGLFSGLKKFFGKTIALGAKQDGQLVYMYPVKNGRLRLNTEIEVKPGFVAVVMHYDTICDVLTEGKYKCSSGQMPKLNRFVKPRLTYRGYIAPKKVVADIYFINLGWFEKLPYSIDEPIPAEHNGKSCKVKLDGTFDMQVTNAISFLKVLLKDRATLRHGVAETESGVVVSEEIYKTLVRFEQQLEAFVSRDNTLISTIEEGLKNNADEKGFSVKNITISNVKIPKRVRKNLAMEEQMPEEEPESEENLDEFKKEVLQTKQAEQSFSEPQKQKVYAGGVRETPQKAMAASDYYEKIASKMDSGELRPQAAPQILDGEVRQPADYGINPSEMLRPASGSTLFNADGTPYVRPGYSPPMYSEPHCQTSPPHPQVYEGCAPAPAYQPQYENPPLQQYVPQAPRQEIPQSPLREQVPEIRCPQCSAAVPSGKKFCPDCGYNMQGFVICFSCGAKNRFEDKVCMVCKSRL